MDWLTDYKIPVGKTAKSIFDWMNDNLGGVFDAISVALEAMIDGILWLLQTPHPFVIVALFVALTWVLQKNWKVCLGVILGFLFILNQGYWEEMTESLTLILSAFFAGISGALGAINFEIVSAENVSAIRSGAVLLFVFIGGIGFFFGPLLGAVVGVFFSVMLSDHTPAWQLYLGLFFILLVRFAPAGLASLILMLVRVASFGKFGRIWKPLAGVSVAALVGLAGFVAGVEMLYHLTLNAANGTVMSLFGQQVDTKAAMPWLVVLAVLMVSIGLYRVFKPVYYAAWSEVNAEITAKLRGSMA